MTWTAAGLSSPPPSALAAIDDVLGDLVLRFIDLFTEPTRLPPVRPCYHRISLLPSTLPVAVRPYQYTHAQKVELESQCVAMLCQGVIRPSTSSFSALVILVKKADEKTVFRMNEGLFKFLIMPFGLTNMPTTFQALMNDVLCPYLRWFVLVFDDILIYNRTWSEHLLHVHLIFTKLQEHCLLIKQSKCSFGRHAVAYLGHVISADGVEMNAQKVQVVKDWPTPWSPGARSGQVKTKVAAGGHGNAWHVINDLITIKGRVFVQRDSAFLADILRHVHETSHEGTEKTWH
jgi:hypothetical protein